MTRQSPILALRSALRQAFLADATLVSLLGGPRFYDEAPRGLVPPYIVFGDSSARDWSSGDRPGLRHTLSLVAWSGQGGDSEVLAIAARLAETIEGTVPAPEGHVLVLLRILSQETSRPRPDTPEASLRRVILRLEALTQPA